jgi:uncharacterized repeat protein (TIGR03803 family)
MQIRISLSSLAGATSLVALCGLAAFGPACAGSYKTLYAFCTQANCADGSTPNSLVADSSGNLYGTVYQGGAAGFGGIFEIEAAARGDRYKLLYSFCRQNNCVDGGYPTGGLILDANGNLYGTALIGGSQGNGEIFELKRDNKGWSLHVLYSFCPTGHDCTDGAGPDSGLAYEGKQESEPYDGTSPLFGTTNGGGNNFGGVAYEIAPGNGGWSYQVIHSFCAQQNCQGTDGSDPVASLSEDGRGNLYGTTLTGGTKNSGTIFELSSTNGEWSENVLYSFCSLANCSDGASPRGGLIFNTQGNLEGTTFEGGGTCSIDPKGCGTAFIYLLDLAREGVYHSFCTKPNCRDGANPQGMPATSPNLFLYGTTTYGGNTNYIPAGGGSLYLLGSALTVLHKFCSQPACADGGQPVAPPVVNSRGQVFGTATIGGAGNAGIVYEYGR